MGISDDYKDFNMPLFIEKGDKTPEIELNRRKGLLLFQGNSYPENAEEFYAPVLKWLNSYIKYPKDITVAKFQIEYVNSTSARIFYHILNMLEKLYSLGYEVFIEWYYEEDDEDIYGKGADLSEKCQIPFHFYKLQH